MFGSGTGAVALAALCLGGVAQPARAQTAATPVLASINAQCNQIVYEEDCIRVIRQGIERAEPFSAEDKEAVYQRIREVRTRYGYLSGQIDELLTAAGVPLDAEAAAGAAPPAAQGDAAGGAAAAPASPAGAPSGAATPVVASISAQCNQIVYEEDCIRVIRQAVKRTEPLSEEDKQLVYARIREVSDRYSYLSGQIEEILSGAGVPPAAEAPAAPPPG
jgi:hypothetical protein